MSIDSNPGDMNNNIVAGVDTNHINSPRMVAPVETNLRAVRAKTKDTCRPDKRGYADDCSW
jgi:hypothetical protein